MLYTTLLLAVAIALILLLSARWKFSAFFVLLFVAALMGGLLLTAILLKNILHQHHIFPLAVFNAYLLLNTCNFITQSDIIGNAGLVGGQYTGDEVVVVHLFTNFQNVFFQKSAVAFAAFRFSEINGSFAGAAVAGAVAESLNNAPADHQMCLVFKHKQPLSVVEAAYPAMNSVCIKQVFFHGGVALKNILVVNGCNNGVVGWASRFDVCAVGCKQNVVVYAKRCGHALNQGVFSAAKVQAQILIPY
jgi:hypothetical protein